MSEIDHMLVPPRRDVFDDVIAERDTLHKQVAMLTQECEDSSREADQWREKAEGLGDQVATLTEALQQAGQTLSLCGAWTPKIDATMKIIEAALAAVRGER